jgi:hypothetical protein
VRVLVACEFSGVVREAFRRRGHDAWSCDLLPTEQDGQHIQDDVIRVIRDCGPWDLMIAHPPCTYLCCAGNKYFGEKYRLRFPGRALDRRVAANFFLELANNPHIPKIATENPVGHMSSYWRKPDQIIQPFQFGDPHRKATCLWLKNLPPLLPTAVVDPIIKTNRNGKTASVIHDAALRLNPLERMKARSRTHRGIADAMAEQWGKP